jgi:hypothetical protein
MPNIPNNGDAFAELRAALQNADAVLNPYQGIAKTKKEPKIEPQDDFARSLTPEQRGEKKRANVWLDPAPVPQVLVHQEQGHVAGREPFVWRGEAAQEWHEWLGNERR